MSPPPPPPPPPVSATGDLISDLKTTINEDRKLQQRVDSLEEGLQQAVNLLEIPKEVASDLARLDKMIATMQIAMVALSAVPGIGAGVTAAKSTLRVAKSQIGPAAKKAKSFDKKVKPFRDRVKKALTATRKFEEKLLELEDVAERSLVVVSATDSCVKKKKDKNLRKALDGFSTAVDPGVEGINAGLRTANKATDSVVATIKKLQKVGKPIMDIDEEIDKFMSSLRSMEKVTNELDKAMRQKITVPYGIKSPVKVKVRGPWPWDWKWSVKWKIETVHFTFTIKQILDGVNGVIAPVQKLLEDGARKALKGLNVDLKLPSIPGLDKLADRVQALTKPADDLQAKLNQLAEQRKDIAKRLSSFEKSFATFDVVCKTGKTDAGKAALAAYRKRPDAVVARLLKGVDGAADKTFKRLADAASVLKRLGKRKRR